MSENPALVACIALQRQALLALQGSSAGECAEKVRRKGTHYNGCMRCTQVLQPLVDLDFSGVYFSEFHKLAIKGIPCYLTRTG